MSGAASGAAGSAGSAGSVGSAGSTSLEVERKYDVDEAAGLPDWVSLPGVATVGDPEPRALDARYFDTSDGALARAASALRRRTGGPDAGWHLKRATPEGKYETHWPLSDGADALETDAGAVPRSVPVEIAAAVAEVVPGLTGSSGAVDAGSFSVIARIRNARTAYALRGADGGLVAEFVDDRVTATDVRRGVETNWREWELELGDAAPADAEGRAALFAAADALVRAAGGRVSPSGSKLGRALGL